jgi:hypothetical protein
VPEAGAEVKGKKTSAAAFLLEGRVFRLCLLQEREVAIGIFPERQELLVRAKARRLVTGLSISARQAEVAQGASRVVGEEPAKTYYPSEFFHGLG